MMLLFFFGMGAAALLAPRPEPLQMAVRWHYWAIASIYHPVGIPC